jgi:tetratricopeptide (TPR) repeat protein
MTRTRIGLGGLVATALTAALLLGGLLADSQSAGRAPRPPADVAAGELVSGFSPGDTAGYVRDLERRVEDNPRDGRSLTLLGLAYGQRARETGDPSLYPRSAQAFRRALALDRDDFLATTGLASLAASRHRFREAYALARRAVRLSPSSAAPYGILGDSLVELGRYGRAFAAFDRMVALKPSLSSYARVAYARELLGMTKAAAAAMRLAVEAGSSVPEHAAWTLVQLGNLSFNSGRLVAAERAYRAALVRLPAYVYAKAGLARVLAARGRTDRAVHLYRAAIDQIPLPEFAAGLSDTLRAAGRVSEAKEVDGLLATIARVLEANGVRTELETALFDLDRDRRVGDALARARLAYRERKSVQAEDVLAWALYKNGRCAEARAHSERALRLGTRDALMRFHRGMIERCLGKGAASRSFFARALAINPYFSPVHAATAKEMLR